MLQSQINPYNLSKLRKTTPINDLNSKIDHVSSFSDSTTSAQEDDDLFPNCSTNDVEEIKTILSSDKRRKEDLQFLSKKLKDIPIFNAIIKKLNIDENEESLLTLFSMLKLEQYEARSIVYAQGSRTSSSAYIILQGTAYKFEDISPVKPKDEKPQQSRKSLLRRVSGLESRENIIESIPNWTNNLIENALCTTPNDLKTDIKNKMLEEMNQLLDMDDDDEEHVDNIEQQDNVKQLKESNPYKSRPSRLNALEKFLQNDGLLINNFEEMGVKPEELTPGDHFGQKALWSMQRRDHTIAAKTACELIVLTADAFRTVKRTAQINKKKLFEFLIGSFPSMNLESDDLMYRSLVNSLTVQTFSHGHSVIMEGHEGNNFYIVYEGECELLKKVVLNSLNNDSAPSLSRPISGRKNVLNSSLFNSQLASVENIGITTLKEGSFFGEELLFSLEHIYCYTVKVTSSEAKVLCFHTTQFLNQFSKTTAVQLKEYYHQRQKRHFEILSHNILLRGYSLDEQTFLEQNKVVLGPQQDSKFRSFYNYQTKIVKEAPSPIPTSSQLLLQGIREKVDTKYANKLRIDSPFSVRSSRPVLDPSIVNLSRVYTPDSMDSERKIFDFIDSPKTEDKPNNSVGDKARPRLSLRVVKNVNDNNNKKTDTLSQFFIATEKTRKVTAVAPTSGERGPSRPKTSQFFMKTDPDEGSQPIRLKFLRATDPKKGLKTILGGKLTPKKQENGEDIGVSGSPRSDYAHLVKMRYKSKFRETNETHDSGAEFNRSLLHNNSNLNKSKDHFYSFEMPLLSHSKSAFKISTVNIHVKHDQKKVHPLQRNRKRVGVVGKAEF